MDLCPAAFLAHGSPMSALGGDEHAARLRAFGERVQGMEAILVVSAHWQTTGPLRITSWEHAALVYDFGGFPEELYRIEYPAPGAPVLAERVADLLRAGGHEVNPEMKRGLDHGAWVPLRLAWPDAATPVVQLSLPELPPRELWQLGTLLRPLRREGVAMIGSGGIVHNLRRVHFMDKDAAIDDWAAEFDGWVAARVKGHEAEKLFEYRRLGPNAAAAVPTTEHFDPLLVAMGAASEGEKAGTIFEGFHYGNLSMRSVAWFDAGYDL